MANLNFPPATPGVPGPEYTFNGIVYYWDGEKWTANNEDGFTDVFVNVDGDTMTGDLTVPNLESTGDVQMASQNGGPLAGFRNHIINGDFRIWQRGTSIATDSTVKYYADRWTYEISAPGSTVSRSPDFVPSGFTYALYIQNCQGSNIQQSVELPEPGNAGPFAIGTVWTYSFCSTTDPATTGDSAPFLEFRDDNPANNTNAATFTPYRTLETDGAFTRYAFTATITNAPASTNNSLVVLVPAPSTGAVRITGVQLEPGPVATPFEHRPIGTELALCQRYYTRDLAVFYSGSTESAGTVYSALSVFPTTMRVSPSIIDQVVSATSGFDTGKASTPDITPVYVRFAKTATSIAGGGRFMVNYAADAEL